MKHVQTKKVNHNDATNLVDRSEELWQKQMICSFKKQNNCGRGMVSNRGSPKFAALLCVYLIGPYHSPDNKKTHAVSNALNFKRTECGHMFVMIFSVQCGGPISIANLVSTTPVSLCHESRWFLIRK